MRVFGYSLAVAALAATCASSLHSQTVDASQILAGAREALGGEKKLSAVKTFTATGRTRQVRGNNLVPIEFEINCELPDKFVRKDESPAQDTDPTTLGFSGDALIQFGAPPGGPQRGQGSGSPAPPGPAAGAPAPPGAGRGAAPSEGRRGGGPALNPAQQRLATVKQDFVRLTLGMFAASFPSFPLTFKYAGEGEAPEGKADVLDVSGPSNFAARFVVQRETHLPVMLMWQGPPTPNQAKPADFRMYYGDFRDVDGLKFPFRIRRAIGSETIEETTLDRIRINAKIDPRKFEVSK